MSFEMDAASDLLAPAELLETDPDIPDLPEACAHISLTLSPEPADFTGFPLFRPPVIDAESNPDTELTLSDGIPASQETLPLDLPVQETNPTLPEEAPTILSGDPQLPRDSLPLTPRAPELQDPVLPEQQGRRLDLTQWLSRAKPGAEVIAEAPTAASLPLSSSGEQDLSLKNTLFARAFSGTDSLAMTGALDLETASGLELTRPVSGSPTTSIVAAEPIHNSARINIPMNINFGQAQWPEALAERTAWLANQKIHTADVQLDPPELGPLQVKISVHQDQTVVTFVSANPQVRELLDQHLVRLREMLQEQGMQLVDAGVSDQQREHHEQTGTLAAEPASGEVASTVDAQAAATEGSASLQTTLPWGINDFA